MDRPKTCEARQYSDQMLCAKCGLIWDMNDPDPPPCRTVNEVNKEIGFAVLSELKEMLAPSK